MSKKDYRSTTRDKWYAAIAIICTVLVIIGIAALAYCHGHTAKSHQLHHLDVANHIDMINKSYAHKNGIKSITFNAKKNYLVIFMASQKGKKAHHYHDDAMPVTSQCHHAIQVGEMIGNSYNDPHVHTHFKY